MMPFPLLLSYTCLIGPEISVRLNNLKNINYIGFKLCLFIFKGLHCNDRIQDMFNRGADLCCRRSFWSRQQSVHHNVNKNWSPISGLWVLSRASLKIELLDYCRSLTQFHTESCDHLWRWLGEGENQGDVIGTAESSLSLVGQSTLPGFKRQQMSCHTRVRETS